MLINYSWFWIAVGAHVILKTPRPFKFSSDGHFNPIDPSGSDFPVCNNPFIFLNAAYSFQCKVPPGKELEADGPPTRMVIGEEQIMSFTGSAVHASAYLQSGHFLLIIMLIRYLGWRQLPDSTHERSSAYQIFGFPGHSFRWRWVSCTESERKSLGRFQDPRYLQVQDSWGHWTWKIYFQLDLEQ